MSEQTEIQLMRLYCKTAALEHLLQFVVFGLAKQNRSQLRHILASIPDTPTVQAASDNVRVGGIPFPFGEGA